MTIEQLITDLNKHAKSSAYTQAILCTDSNYLYFICEVKVTHGTCYIFYEDNPSEYSMSCKSLVAELHKYQWQKNYPVEFIYENGNYPYSNFKSSVTNHNVLMDLIS